MEPFEIANMTHSLTDTICAISTPPGAGGIAVARISGPEAFDVVGKIWRGRPLHELRSHTAHLGNIFDADGNLIDQAVATIYRAPGSFTGEDVVEVAVHGSTYVQQMLLKALMSSGARLADRGEFTRRAFSAGKMDLAQAEAVADLIASQNRAAHATALNQMRGGFSRRLNALHDSLLNLASLLELELDFSEEDVEFASRQQLMTQAIDLRNEIRRLEASFDTGNALQHGIPVAIIGATNVGKSSLLNALVDDDRAIVSDIHGTTRDIIEDTANIGDFTFRFIDTAGLRDTTDTVERLGIERSRNAVTRAAILLLVVDITDIPASLAILDDALLASIRANRPRTLVIFNKIDLRGHESATPENNATSGQAALTAEGAEASEGNRAGTSQSGLSVDDAETAGRSRLIAALPEELRQATILEISASTGQGLDILRRAIADTAAATMTAAGDIVVTNRRHQQALTAALAPLDRVIDGLRNNLSGDFIAQDLREVLHHLGTITGAVTTPQILTTIFSRFCIGK